VQVNSYVADGQTKLHTLPGVGLVVSAVAFNNLATTPRAQPAVPMTVAQKGAIHAATASMRFYEAVEFAIRKTEAAHGITKGSES
jgi:hypothetical protein